eukprot:TRINITY_DN2331_c0_g1_i1.p1 TRINITY_DN2331_c0_g1~~TRINITY_DN2331_c0_g1_i1.p1  ORF type:complete len:645 (-),score=126.46 TRINITY_DN2331_c0_g1_i1:19-1953(-)
MKGGLILINLLVVVLIFSKEVEGVEWAIRFDENHNIDIQEFSDKYGLQYEGKVGILDVHLFSIPDSQKRDQSAVSFVQWLESSKEGGAYHPVTWFEEQIKRKREKRMDIRDPLYQDQWHLHSVKPADVRNHLDLEKVWEKGHLGKGIRIAIVDDGIQTTHPDVAANIALDSSYNFNLNKPSPDPTYLHGPSGDWHGTASAGAAAARIDHYTCGVGAAPEAELAGIAILQNNADVSDSVEAKALVYEYHKNHIYSNSWGPIQPGAGHMNEAPGPLLDEAIRKAIKEGRGGKGSIYVWAAGNDGRAQDNCNYDGYANMRYTILIGSVDNTGFRPTYSEPCAALTAVTPGGTITAAAKIFTTDLLGPNGLSDGNCTTFAGTSASCPMAAGVLALVLEANPGLSWLDLQYVLAKGADKHNDDPDWVQNGGGYWVSHHYGWGLMNPEKLIIAAQEWGSKTIKEHIIEKVHAEPTKIEGVTKTALYVEESMALHHVEVKLWTTNRNVANTEVILESPFGTKARLVERHRDTLSSWNGWKFLSRMHWGEDSKGDWTLYISDAGEKAELTKWELILYGDEDTLGKAETPTSQDDEQPTTEPKEIENEETSEFDVTVVFEEDNMMNILIVATVVVALILSLIFVAYYKSSRKK